MRYSFGGFGNLPVVVKNILIVNILFFLATFSLGRTFNIDLYDLFGLHFPLAEMFSPFQFVTYMFMHGDFWHLFFNMFALWMFGRVLEDAWGPGRFLLYYFVTGLGAALIHYAVVYYQMLPALNLMDAFLDSPSHEGLLAFLNSEHFRIFSPEMQQSYQNFASFYNTNAEADSVTSLNRAVAFLSEYKEGYLNMPNVVGASGAVFGILLAFGMLYPNTMLYVYFAIPIKAKYFVMIYGALELYLGLSNNAGDNVAHFAHLGGMIFGFFLIKYWRKK